MATYTVVKGDTLSALARKFNTTVAKLVSLNNIKDPNLIVIGQVLQIDGTPSAVATNTSSTARIDVFGLQSNTTGTVYATWTWSKDHTDHYQVMWYYDTGDNVWFVGTNTTTEETQSLYSAPENAKRVKFKVKPVSETYTNNNKETTYWTASWSTEKIYDFEDNPPVTPPVPVVTVEDYKLLAVLDNLGDLNATHINFQVVKDNTTIFKTSETSIKALNYARYSCYISAGHEYKVRVRSYKGDRYSEWSAFSDNYSTMPANDAEIEVCRANSETSVYLEWSEVSSATSYDIEYATKSEYLEGSNQTTTVNGIKTTHYEVGGLESGERYFFRVRAVNDHGESDWSDIESTIIGKKPSAPTTWSSTTTCIAGEDLTLYWVHNSEDGSSQVTAELELIINGVKTVQTITNSTDEDEKDKTSFFTMGTSTYREGSQILWRVRTCGITKEYGDWSIQRTVDVYAPPTLTLTTVDILAQFPLNLLAAAGPSSQKPLSYHVTITSTESYETVDSVGNLKMVSKGAQVFSRHYDVNMNLVASLYPNDLDLENNVTYTMHVIVSMDSGLTAEDSHNFKVAWTDVIYEPNAQVSIDKTTLTASINPYCIDENDDLIPGVTLAVYRREFDGTFTLIADGIDNVTNTFVTDPHPALDYARYRIVAIDNKTGAVSHYDMPGIPVDEVGAVIQWDDEWKNFNTVEEEALEEPVWAGSMLKLMYNVDISENHDPEVSLVEYAGRKHPVSYYGTQLGESSSWSMEIPKSDVDTLYALRRLARWTGDVYVRESSGIGHWANVKVSFGQTHRELTIPISISVTRVEGGA